METHVFHAPLYSNHVKKNPSIFGPLVLILNNEHPIQIKSNTHIIIVIVYIRKFARFVDAGLFFFRTQTVSSKRFWDFSQRYESAAPVSPRRLSLAAIIHYVLDITTICLASRICLFLSSLAVDPRDMITRSAIRGPYSDALDFRGGQSNGTYHHSYNRRSFIVSVIFCFTGARTRFRVGGYRPQLRFSTRC